jgi:phage tail protein X
VPAQGQDVLRKLLTAQHNVIVKNSCLHKALGIHLPDPSEQSAQQVFRFVSGVK